MTEEKNVEDLAAMSTDDLRAIMDDAKLIPWDEFIDEVDWRLKSVGISWPRETVENLISTTGLTRAKYEAAREAGI